MSNLSNVRHVQDRLTSLETDNLVQFFLYTMDQPTRGRLAGNYPVIYAKLFPSVSVEFLHRESEAQIATQVEGSIGDRTLAAFARQRG